MPRPNPAYGLDVNQVLDLYNKGIGVAGIAKKLGFTRTQMIGFFKRNHIHMRNPREQQIERMKFSTPEQISHLVEAAHKATKGRKITVEEKERHAVGRYKSKNVKSIYERIFIKTLDELNIKYEFQFPIGVYNVDFLIDGVIVELFGGEWHCSGYHKDIFPVRTKFLLNKNYPILFVFTNDEQLFEKEIYEKIIPMIKKMKISDKGKFTILWKNGEYSSGGDISNVETALIRPYTAIRNKKTGRFESVKRQVNFIKA